MQEHDTYIHPVIMGSEGEWISSRSLIIYLGNLAKSENISVGSKVTNFLGGSAPVGY